eukprot:CAMPEP_0179702684 /NCGR_PEP_ID=MMETSP0937-20121108/2403_1 /TAXON_ID=548131 ORGANISM="Ostreococcus mediterraneus, Strain clade-D-RCC2593" /NCGR_SAMPLE_ID=MMETSP0937 /ASSEMBLY_ACC=CAM_ASM_000575 /LENGTH=50 /DNA_ID=CAMNT_0021575823 /DNA_START=111 /DNA_END=263 /DNA_ORIENTATION=-
MSEQKFNVAVDRCVCDDDDGHDERIVRARSLNQSSWVAYSARRDDDDDDG